MYTCFLCFGYLIDYQGRIYRLYVYPEEKLVLGTVMVVIVGLLDLQLSVQAVHITTKVVSSNPAHGEVVLIQHFVIKFVSDRTVIFSGYSGFLYQ